MTRAQAKKTADTILKFVDITKLPKVSSRKGRGGETRKQFRDKLIRAFTTSASLELIGEKLILSSLPQNSYDLNDIVPTQVI